MANKRSTTGRRTVVIDAGVNLLFTSFWYNLGVFPSREVSDFMEDTTIYGPLCMNIDVVRDAINFPQVKTGDRLVIERVGAYNVTQWMQFITYRPNVVLIDLEGKAHIIKKRMQFITYRPNVVLIDLEGKAHIIKKKENLETLKGNEFNPKR